MTEVQQELEETGQIRPPRKGEWFLGLDGQPRKADHDFRELSLPILQDPEESEHIKVIEDELEEAREQLITCIEEKDRLRWLVEKYAAMGHHSAKEYFRER